MQTPTEKHTQVTDVFLAMSMNHKTQPEILKTEAWLSEVLQMPQDT